MLVAIGVDVFVGMGLGSCVRVAVFTGTCVDVEDGSEVNVVVGVKTMVGISVVVFVGTDVGVYVNVLEGGTTTVWVGISVGSCVEVCMGVVSRMMRPSRKIGLLS